MIYFVLRSTGKTIGDHGIKWGGKTLLDLDYADDLSKLYGSMSKMNEFLEVLRVQDARIGLKINVKKTKSLRLGISEDEKVTLGNETIDQVGSFTCLGSIISKDSGSSISNSRLYEKCGSTPISWAVMKERLRWLGHVMQMKDYRLLKIVLFGQPSGTTRKASRSRLLREDVTNKDPKEMVTSWEGVKREALNRLDWRRSVCSCVGPQAA